MNSTPTPTPNPTSHLGANNVKQSEKQTEKVIQVSSITGNDRLIDLANAGQQVGGVLPGEVNTPFVWESIFELLFELLSSCMNSTTADQVVEEIEQQSPRAVIATRRATRSAYRLHGKPRRLATINAHAELAVQVMSQHPKTIRQAAEALAPLDFDIFG